MFKISDYSKRKAIALGVKIRPSIYSGKKIDVLDWNNNYIVSIGAIGYKDYGVYLEEKGKKYADERRRLYRIRHSKDRNVIGSAGYYADRILW